MTDRPPFSLFRPNPPNTYHQPAAAAALGPKNAMYTYTQPPNHSTPGSGRDAPWPFAAAAAAAPPGCPPSIMLWMKWSMAALMKAGLARAVCAACCDSRCW